MAVGTHFSQLLRMEMCELSTEVHHPACKRRAFCRETHTLAMLPPAECRRRGMDRVRTAEMGKEVREASREMTFEWSMEEK